MIQFAFFWQFAAAQLDSGWSGGVLLKEAVVCSRDVAKMDTTDSHFSRWLTDDGVPPKIRAEAVCASTKGPVNVWVVGVEIIVQVRNFGDTLIVANTMMPPMPKSRIHASGQELKMLEAFRGISLSNADVWAASGRRFVWFFAGSRVTEEEVDGGRFVVGDLNCINPPPVRSDATAGLYRYSHVVVSFLEGDSCGFRAISHLDLDDVGGGCSPTPVVSCAAIRSLLLQQNVDKGLIEEVVNKIKVVGMRE
jgi:hypothetical protein